MRGAAFPRLRRAAPHGELARVLLAFLASAGIYYVNIMPALVDGLIQGAGFSNREAGLIGSANLYGAAAGALAAVWLVRRVAWRRAACVLLTLLLCADLLSMLVPRFEPLLVLRFAHGLVGGMLVGTGFAVIARTREADRSFGYLLLVQFGLGGAGLMLLPPLVPIHGTWVLYAALMAFSAATLLMVPFLDAYPVDPRPNPAVHGSDPGIRWWLLLPSLLATFAFQAGNMAVFAYVIGIGEAAGHGTSFVSRWVGVASWLGLAGAALVIVLSTRFGRAWPLSGAILLTALGTWALHRSDLAAVYVIGNCLVGITWAVGISYLLGLCSAFDRSGQMAALAGFASKMGLASGPMLAALVVADGDYTRVIDVGVGALVLGLLAAWVPARALDGEARQEAAEIPQRTVSVTAQSD